MKAVVEIMESDVKPLYFITINIPQKNTEHGPEFTTFVNETHTSIQIAVEGKPKLKVVGEPGGLILSERMFGESDLMDFMESTFTNEVRTEVEK